MITTFHYDKKLEGQRLLSIYWSIGRNIYSSHGFYPLPYRSPKNPQVIYLPEIKGINPKELVEDTLKLNFFTIPLTDKIFTTWVETINKLIKNHESIDFISTNKVELEWKSIETVFENYLCNLLPELRNKNIRLDVYWTRYGSLMSYNDPIVKGVKSKISIFLRDDMGVAQIIEGILSVLLMQKFNKLEISWLQRETISDFLMLETGIKNFSTEFYPTVLKKYNQHDYLNTQIITDSEKYIRHLGLESQNLLMVKNNIVFIHNKPSKIPFGSFEKKFLEILISNTNEAVSYFDISDKVWSENEDSFSLWALSQLAYKIKNKLRKSGINPEVVKNVRGVGYIFVPQE